MSEPLLPSSESGQATVPRRRYSVEFKRTLVEESLRPGASTAKLALQHGLNGNLLHTWRWQYRSGALGPVVSTSPSLIPVDLSGFFKPTSSRNFGSVGLIHSPIPT